jgi:uncharacterized protein (DUF111 family)
MEIKIKHHPAHELTAQEINAVLTKNGIVSTIEKNGKDVYITIAKKEEEVDSDLGSSFVHFDSVPGY